MTAHIFQRVLDYVVAEDVAIELSFKDGDINHGQSSVIHIAYEVEAYSNAGTAFEIAESIPLLCIPDNVEPAMLAAIIDQRIAFTRDMVNAREAGEKA